MDFITVGEILKAQGIKGEVKIRPLTDNIARFKKLKAVYINGNLYKISSCRLNEKFVYLNFLGVEDRNSAQALVGKNVEIDAVNSVTLDDSTFFIKDIIGSKVYEGQTFLGEVTDVLQYGAADVFEISGEHKILFPFLNRCVDKIDVSNKVIYVNNGFYGVSVYEN